MRMSWIALLLAAGPLWAAAEEPRPQPPPTPLPAPPTAGDTGQAPDPTAPSPRLREVMRRDEKPVEKTPAKLPILTLKGLVLAEGQPPAAMLSLDGATAQLVREGSRLSAGGEGGALTLIVRKITASGLELEVEELKKTISVR